MKAKFKIYQLAAKDSAEVELIHPKHGPTGIMVTLAGPIHPSWKEGLKRFRESEQTEDDNLDLLTSVVLAWDGEAFERPLTPEAAKEVFGNPANEWMVEFITRTVLDNTQFFH